MNYREDTMTKNSTRDDIDDAPSKPLVWAYIRSGAAKRRSAVNSYQATLFAHVTQRLERAIMRKLGTDHAKDLPADDETALAGLDEYELWIEAAFACGFVMDNGKPEGDLDAANRDPEGTVGRMTFPELRQYVHYLQRTDKWNDGFGIPIYRAIRSGALGIVAERLLSDMSLHEPDD